ncbi:MAG: CPBP family intramembrane metalloprotease [Thermoclostridium sp.]|nr:CPBP family intramembrane metalloprotease [Thermoclostridium sp.]
MLSVIQKKPKILVEAQKAKFMPSFGIQVLIFFALLIITSIAQVIPLFIAMFFKTFQAVMNQEINPYDTQSVMGFTADMQGGNTLITLFATVLTTVLVVLYCRFIEKRSLYSMGFTKKNAFGQYMIGLLVGFVMFGACLLIALASGSLQYNGFTLGNSYGLLLGFLLGFVLQGMSEEVFLRGYFMMSVASKNSILLAVISNSVIFAILHLLNPGVTFLSVVNLILFGLFASVYTLKTNNIWGICALHTIWNFAQGNLFGILVSGLETEVSVLSFQPVGTSTLINGGAFGLEGGLAVTIVLIISTLVVLKLPGKEIITPDVNGADIQSPPQASAT